ncbi:MAG TPA: ABC transporter ATP-binding protein [Clostridiales bacterium]|jgi:ABC-2 type transport system ATP-binding protein|nr:ABC transporter ATP-binding protein [Clostridiales bacterium]
MIEISNLTKIYKSSNIKAVDNLSLTVNAGEIYGFLGPNGAGKSTTIKCLTGILPFTEGHIKICGIDIKEEPVKAKMNIGYVPDEHIIYEGLTGFEYMTFIADVFNVPHKERKERIEKYSKLFEMEGKLNNKISSYSHGMKQKVSLISALVHQPKVWVLDEPMSGLDPVASYNLKQLMAEHTKQGNVVFFSSHVLEVVQKVCTKVAIIDKGKLIAVCGMEELKKKREDMSLEELFLSLTKNTEAAHDNI